MRRFLPSAFLLLPSLSLLAQAPWDMLNPPLPSTAIYFSSASGGQRGVPMQCADFDGDGLLDVAASPFSASTLGRTDNGVVEVIFGDGTIGATIDMSTYTGRRLRIHGGTANALLGVEMAAADFDGDGFADLVIGSSHGRYVASAPRAGEVVILYGSARWGTLDTTFDIATLPTTQRVRFVLGQRDGDRLGSWFTAKDLDGDDLLDLVAGMDLSDGVTGNRANSGAAVILWNPAQYQPQLPFLRVGDAATSDAMTILYGVDAGDQLGATTGAGDLDGDGAQDLVLGAGVTRSGLSYGQLGYSGTGGGDGPPGSPRTNAGEATILWNAPQLRAHRSLWLGALPLDVPRTVLYGESATDYFGEEITIGEVTGDGLEDLVIGALGRDNGTKNSAGATYLLRGGAPLRSAASIDMLTPPANLVSYFLGNEVFGISGDTVEIFDLNEDGIGELIIGTPYGTSLGRNQAGYAHVIFGGQPMATRPDSYTIGITLTPSLMHTIIYGAESPLGRGDFFIYSSAFGDVDGDGVPDLLPNSMQGDGFQNAFLNAGESYVLSGRGLAEWAAAPQNVRLADAPNLFQWNAGQPVYGPIIGYRIHWENGVNVGSTDVAGTALPIGTLPAGVVPKFVSTLMQKGNLTRESTLIAAPELPDPTQLWILH